MNNNKKCYKNNPLKLKSACSRSALIVNSVFGAVDRIADASSSYANNQLHDSFAVINAARNAHTIQQPAEQKEQTSLQRVSQR